MAGTALNSLATTTAGTVEIETIADTTLIAGVTIVVVVTDMMVNVVTEVIDIGAGTVLRWGLTNMNAYLIFWHRIMLTLLILIRLTERKETAQQRRVWWRTPLGWWLLWAWLQRRPSWREGEQDHHAPGSAHEHHRGRCKSFVFFPQTVRNRVLWSFHWNKIFKKP